MLLCLINVWLVCKNIRVSASSLRESAGINWAVTTRPSVCSCCGDTQIHTYHQGDVRILAAAFRKSTNAILFAAAAMNLFCREEASGEDAVLG